MSKQYIHLSAYSCDKCHGPVFSASLAVRENVISKETDIRQVGAICLSCGHRQPSATGVATVRHFPPVEWEPGDAIELRNLTTAFCGGAESCGLALSRRGCDSHHVTDSPRRAHFVCGRGLVGMIVKLNPWAFCVTASRD